MRCATTFCSFCFGQSCDGGARSRSACVSRGWTDCWQRDSKPSSTLPTLRVIKSGWTNRKLRVDEAPRLMIGQVSTSRCSIWWCAHAMCCVAVARQPLLQPDGSYFVCMTFCTYRSVRRWFYSFVIVCLIVLVLFSFLVNCGEAVVYL